MLESIIYRHMEILILIFLKYLNLCPDLSLWPHRIALIVSEKKFKEALLKLNPLDRLTVKEWDEVIKYRFSLPPKDYRQEVERFYLLYNNCYNKYMQ